MKRATETIASVQMLRCPSLALLGNWSIYQQLGKREAGRLAGGRGRHVILGQLERRDDVERIPFAMNDVT